MKKFILLAMLAYAVTVYSASPVMLNEINYLLDYVKQTDCQFERNGKSYNGNEAGEHIRKKYDYYIDKIDSTEKFIELSATKSMMSGRYYMIACEGKSKLKSRDWLLNELKEYRSNSEMKVDSR